MRNRPRLAYVDYAKVIGIWLVCLGHFLPVSSDLRIFLYSFHVPVFFLLAGMCARPGRIESRANLIGKIKKLIHRILIPYGVWYWISAVPAWLIDGAGPVDLVRNFLFLDGRTIWNTALWFLPCYFLVMVCFSVVRFLAKDHSLMMIGSALVSFAAAYLLDALQITDCLFGLNKCCLLYTFTVAGYAIGGTGLCSGKMKSDIAGWSAVVFAAAGVFSVFYHAGNNISIMNLDYNNIVVYTIVGTVMSAAFVGMCTIFPENALIGRMAEGTLTVMASHLFARLFLQRAGVQQGVLYWGTGGVLLPACYGGLCAFIIKCEKIYGKRITAKAIGLV